MPSHAPKLTSFTRRLKVSILNALCRTLGLGLVATLFSNHSAVSQEAVSNRADALVIGVLLPPEEPQARSLRQGVLLANKQFKEKTGSELRVSIRGRVGQWGADAVEAARLVTDESAAGLIAPPDGAASHLVLQVSGRTAVPVVTLCAEGSVGEPVCPGCCGWCREQRTRPGRYLPACSPQVQFTTRTGWPSCRRSVPGVRLARTC